MDLTGVLSNIQTEALYQRLTRRAWRQVRREVRQPRDRARDGKLKFGTVSGAVLDVLGRAEGPMRYFEIHGAVEELLGFPVCRSSVKQLLSADIRSKSRRVNRVARGLYEIRFRLERTDKA